MTNRIPTEKDPHGVFNAHLDSGAVLYTDTDLGTLMPPKPADSNKGTYGRSAVFAGNRLYPGAALLAAKGCLAGGTGLLSVYSDEAARLYFASLPEAIFRAGYTFNDAKTAIDGSDAVLLGPGRGDDVSIELLEYAFQNAKTLVLDADGLNFLARNRGLFPLLGEKCVLTPHPGEMARLTGLTIADITADPVKIAETYAKEWGCTVLLKGTCTVIASPHETGVTASGNCGLAKGGSGDVLAGLITAMLARKLTPHLAAVTGSLLLGAGADAAYKALGERLLRAGNVAEAIENNLI